MSLVVCFGGDLILNTQKKLPASGRRKKKKKKEEGRKGGRQEGREGAIQEDVFQFVFIVLPTYSTTP